jgi:hypothetical protein
MYFIADSTLKTLPLIYGFGNKIDLKGVWVFIGIFQASKLGIDSSEWRKVLTDKGVLKEILR